MDTGTANGYYGPGTINKTPTVNSGATGQSLKLFNMVFTLMVSIQAPSMANLHKMLPTV
ncbi:hypothetical protein [Lactiplantibacillus paraplantarum]|uniref:hypothetical protein n=1 Tax=Lactiplantibacillus paraplantarum TaxID=60520 RepID=UPI001CDC7F52|nr:hypothetical protein [Lactiplantibacillus paraplantarum]